MSRFSTIPIFVCICVLLVTPWAGAKVRKWADYTQPFKTRIENIDEKDPEIVEIDLPESVVENKELVLIVSTALSSGSYSGAVLLSVNGREFPSLIRKPMFKVELGQGVIKPGTNRLTFLSSTRESKMDVYYLRLELRDPVAKVSSKPSIQDPEGTIYMWNEYTKPLKTRIKVTSDKPGIVRVDLPASIIDHDKVILDISTSPPSKEVFGSRISIRVNDTDLPSFRIGAGTKIALQQGVLKAGINTLKFTSSNSHTPGPRTTEIEVYDLGFEFPPAKPTPTQSSPPPAAKPLEAKLPAVPEPPQTSLPPASVEPATLKRKEPPRTEKAGAAPNKEAAAAARTDLGQRWAVVIGVSEYEDSRIPGLRYAARDARAVYDWLVSPSGGRFVTSQVMLLLDRKATNEGMRSALFSWLKQAIEEDLVFIYFAGHGSPESPDAVRNLYLLPYNTNYSNIAVTGFPMWDIETALKRFIKAKRVVIIADACHSAGVGQAFDMAARTGRDLQVNPINSGLQNLTDLGEGICVISASRDNELSREGREWGGGHGVFSYYLLEGLKGAADFDKSGSVTIGELTVYVSQQVRRATLNAQNPIISGRFDPSLTISK
jgi:uncharacterized caspase-like protein